MILYLTELLTIGNPQGAAQIADWNTPQSFCERGLFACPGALGWEAGFTSGTQLEVYRDTLK